MKQYWNKKCRSRAAAGWRVNTPWKGYLAFRDKLLLTSVEESHALSSMMTTDLARPAMAFLILTRKDCIQREDLSALPHFPSLEL